MSFFDSTSFTLKIRPKRASFMIEGFWRTGYPDFRVHHGKNTRILSPHEQKRQINAIRKFPFTGVPVRVFLRANIRSGRADPPPGDTGVRIFFDQAGKKRVTDRNTTTLKKGHGITKSGGTPSRLFNIFAWQTMTQSYYASKRCNSILQIIINIQKY